MIKVSLILFCCELNEEQSFFFFFAIINHLCVSFVKNELNSLFENGFFFDERSIYFMDV